MELISFDWGNKMFYRRGRFSWFIERRNGIAAIYETNKMVPQKSFQNSKLYDKLNFFTFSNNKYSLYSEIIKEHIFL